MDLGPRRLRDLPNPITVFQLQAAGLRTDFLPLRGVDSDPGNLRPAITSLIGRDAEVSNLQAALRSHRLVTLAGVGGVGKTRLALEVATQLADEFVDGAHLRTVLGDEDYESLARKGETMNTAEIATYAYDQIDQARAELNAVAK